MSSSLPSVSIIIPMFNEADFIGNCLNGFMNQDYPKNKFEIIVIDGMSDDGSKDRVVEYQKKFSNIILLENKKRITPVSFNIGIKTSNYEIVAIFSAHSIPKSDYITNAVNVLKTKQAECVGGPMDARGNSVVGKAIAHATSTPFGIGNSVFHYSKKPGYVNTVYQGFFYKELFDKIGLFDEDLIRNQDDEMSYRIQKFGGKIYFDPRIRSIYYNRSSLGKLVKQYYQYGIFKPLVFYKTRHGMQIHHFIPSLFVFYLIGYVYFYDSLFYFGPLLIYLFLCLCFSMFSNIPLKSKIASIIIYPLIHISYGLGFIFGFIKVLSKL